MTAAVETQSARITDEQLNLLFQYTIEAYKTFEKLAENLPNPMTAGVFKQFAVDERLNRDLIELKISSSAGRPLRVTLGADLRFQEILEGDLSYRESSEFLIARERTMQRRIEELTRSATRADRNLLVFLSSIKRAHVVELERELELIRADGDWWKREDAEWRIVHGPKSE